MERVPNSSEATVMREPNHLEMVIAACCASTESRRLLEVGTTGRGDYSVKSVSFKMLREAVVFIRKQDIDLRE